MKANSNNQETINGNNLLESSVRVDEKSRKVFIGNLSVESPEFYEILRKCKTGVDRITKTKKVIDIGAFVHSKVERAMDTDYFDRRVVEMTHEFKKGLEEVKTGLLETVAERFDPGKTNSYTEQIERFFAAKKAEFDKSVRDSLSELSNSKKVITDKIDESFNPELQSSYLARFITAVTDLQNGLKGDFDIDRAGSITHQMKALIEQTLGEDGQLIKAIDSRLSFDNPKSTIKLLQDNLMAKLEEIKTELAATKSATEAEQAAMAKSTQKGYEFEALVMERLEELASVRGDLVEDVSTIAGDISRSKQGDFVYTLSALGKTIAIEAKNTSMPTPVKLLDLMNTTKANRRADYVICVYAEEARLHKQVSLFQEYEDDKLVTHFGLLEVALKVAISRLLLDNNVVEGIDRAAAEKEIDSIRNSFNSLRSVKTSANTIMREAEKIFAHADQIRAEVSDSVESLTELLLTVDDNQ